MSWLRRRRLPARWRKPDELWIWPHAAEDCDQERLIVILDENGFPDREVCPICGREFPR